MAPDIEDLIKRVNSLTLDKNRLRQKLTQLSQASGGCATATFSAYNSQHGSNRKSSPPSSGISSNQQHSQENLDNSETGNRSSINRSSSSDSNSPTTPNSPSSSSLSAQQQPATTSSNRGNGGLPNRVIAGVECTTSCEEDLVFMNELYRKRIDEYNDKWDYIQSKCSALLSELNALQEHFALQRREKLELEEKLKESCDENESIRSELQTVVLNYETQLSAMSEHLSMITSKVALDDNDDLARVQ